MSVTHTIARPGLRTCLLGVCLSFALLAPARAQDDELGDLDDKPAAPSEESESSADDTSTDGEAAPEKAAPASEPDAGPAVLVQPYAGIGIAMRSFERPIDVGIQKLSASAVPGVEVGLGVVAWPEASFSLGFNLAYQSALGFTVTESPSFAMPNRVRARSERAALDIAPTWRFGKVSLAVPIGASMRTLWPEVHVLMTPGYSLIGAHARLELSVRAGERLTVRVAPEFQWIAQIDEDLRATGVSSQGAAFGGEATINVALSSQWQLGVNYRESHAAISTTRDTKFKDVERYLTLRGTGSF